MQELLEKWIKIQINGINYWVIIQMGAIHMILTDKIPKREFDFL